MFFEFIFVLNCTMTQAVKVDLKDSSSLGEDCGWASRCGLDIHYDDQALKDLFLLCSL